MKKFVLVIMVLALAGTAFAQDINLSAGAGINYELLGETTVIDALDQSTTINSNGIGFNAFFDATFAVVALEYNMSIGDPSSVVRIDGERNDAAEESADSFFEGLQSSYLNLSLLGKYPFDLGVASIFPLLGFEYGINLTLNVDDTDLKDGMSDEELAELNDFFGLIGVGADFEIIESLYVRPSVLFGWNFTVEDEGVDSASGSKLKAGVQVGYSF